MRAWSPLTLVESSQCLTEQMSIQGPVGGGGEEEYLTQECERDAYQVKSLKGACEV